MVVQLTDAELDQVLRALADKTRRDIVRRTMVAESPVSTLAADYDMSFAAVQKHVAVLEAAGLVSKRAQGRQRFVCAIPDRVAQARTALQQLKDLWRHRLGALDDILTPTEE